MVASDGEGLRPCYSCLHLTFPVACDDAEEHLNCSRQGERPSTAASDALESHCLEPLADSLGRAAHRHHSQVGANRHRVVHDTSGLARLRPADGDRTGAGSPRVRALEDHLAASACCGARTIAA